jgi:hypothetical protein
MNKQTIKIAIAESMGIECYTFGDRLVYNDDLGVMVDVPDYTGDLNACAEFEKHLRGTDEEHFNNPIIHRRWKEYNYTIMNLYGVSASAEERCHVYLRVMTQFEKWIGGES